MKFLTALAGAVALAGCSSDAPPEPPDHPASLSSQLSTPVRLQGSYLLAGRRHRVDAQIAFDNLTDPYRESMGVAEPGTRLVGVQLRVQNRGADAFPLEWARFRGYDEGGHPLPAGTQSTPLRKTVPKRPVRGQVLTSITAFRVPRGRHLAAIRVRSIVRLWRFEARWTLKRR